MVDVSPTQRGGTNFHHQRTKSTDSAGAARSSAPPETEPERRHDPATVRATLDRLLASPPFRKSAQLANFLRFVVEEALADRGDRIKAYTIATAALGRDDTFDPQADPIVRVEAARLRRALRTYYANGGGDDAIVIELPTGSYTPVFRDGQPQQRPAVTRLRETWRELFAYARANRHLLLLIFGIAVVVSVAVELIDALIFASF
jgi:hypothetical protein